MDMVVSQSNIFLSHVFMTARLQTLPLHNQIWRGQITRNFEDHIKQIFTSVSKNNIYAKGKRLYDIDVQKIVCIPQSGRRMLSIKLTIQKPYELGYTNGHLYTSIHTFHEGIFTNNQSHVPGRTVYINENIEFNNGDI